MFSLSYLDIPYQNISSAVLILYVLLKYWNEMTLYHTSSRNSWHTASIHKPNKLNAQYLGTKFKLNNFFMLRVASEIKINILLYFIIFCHNICIALLKNYVIVL